MNELEKKVKDIGSDNVWSRIKYDIEIELNSISNCGECRILSKEQAEEVLKKYKTKI